MNGTAVVRRPTPDSFGTAMVSGLPGRDIELYVCGRRPEAALVDRRVTVLPTTAKSTVRPETGTAAAVFTIRRG